MGLLFNGQEWLYLAALPGECMSLSFHKGDRNCLGYFLILENKQTLEDHQHSYYKKAHDSACVRE